MQLLTPLCEQALIGDVLDHSMFEDIFQLWKKAFLMDQLNVFQCLQVMLDLCRHIREPCQQTQAELPANDRSGLHGTHYWLFEMIDTRADNILNRRRKLDPCVSSPADTAVVAGQKSALVQGVGDLFNE